MSREAEVIDIIKVKGITTPVYYKQNIDHLVMYTGAAADAIANKSVDYPVTWGGYILCGSQTYILVSVGDPGAAFRKWRCTNGFNKVHLEIVEFSKDTSLEGKNTLFMKLLDTIPVAQRANKRGKFYGKSTGLNVSKTLSHHTIYAIKVVA